MLTCCRRFSWQKVYPQITQIKLNVIDRIITAVGHQRLNKQGTARVLTLNRESVRSVGLRWYLMGTSPAAREGSERINKSASLAVGLVPDQRFDSSNTFFPTTGRRLAGSPNVDDVRT